MAMPDFIKKKIAQKNGESESASGSESESGSGSESASGPPAAKKSGKPNPLKMWADKNKKA